MTAVGDLICEERSVTGKAIFAQLSFDHLGKLLLR